MENNLDSAKRFKRLITIFLFRYFRIIIIVATLLTFFLGYTFVIKSKRADINLGQQEAVKKREEEKEKLLGYLDQLKKYRLEYEKIPLSSRDRIEKFLPEKSQEQGIILELEKIFSHFDVEITEISLAEQSSKASSRSQGSRSKTKAATSKTGLPEDLGVLEINVKTNSEIGYEELKELLDRIEKNLRLMDIERLSYDNGTGALDMLIKIYYLKS